MAKTSAELEKEFIDNVTTQTGKSLDAWMKLVKASGNGKRNDILQWIKKDHGLNHLQAQFIAGIFLNDGKPVYIDQGNLLDIHFRNSPDLKSTFDFLSEKIIVAFKGTQLIPKKTYLSFTAVREFVAVNVKTQELRVGLDLGDMRFSVELQQAKLTGPMPRFTHMIFVNEVQQVDKRLMQLIKQSYERTHTK